MSTESEPNRIRVTFRWATKIALRIVVASFCCISLAGLILVVVVVAERRENRAAKEEFEAILGPSGIEQLEVQLNRLAAEYRAEIPEINAADFYQRAFDEYKNYDWGRFNNIDLSLPLQGDYEIPRDGTRIPHSVIELCTQYLERNEQRMEYLEQAVSIENCSFPLDLENGANVLLPHLARMRNESRNLGIKALVGSGIGDASMTADAIASTVILAKHLNGEPILISQLVSIAIAAIALRQLEYNASVIQLTENDLERIAALTREIETVEAFAGVAEFEYASMTFGASKILSTDLPQWGLSNEEILRTIYIVQTWKHYSEMSAYYQFMTEDFESLCNRLEVVPYSELDLVASEDVSLDFIFGGLATSMKRSMKALCRHLATCRMIRLVCAVEQYRLDNGSIPMTTEALVPKYLESVLVDPFDGAPLRYEPRIDGYKIWTVSDNLIDEGGVEGESIGDIDYVVRIYSTQRR